MRPTEQTDEMRPFSEKQSGVMTKQQSAAGEREERKTKKKKKKVDN